jgi:Fe-S cluster biogenesis protein NfuA
MHQNIRVYPEPTPNPSTMKFVVDREICQGTFDFPDAPSAFDSPLAYKIFGFPWASRVLLGSDFITVTKQDWVDWEILAQPLSELIAEHLQRGEPVMTERSAQVQAEAGILESDTDEVKEIKRVLFEEIRPAVAMDGGEVAFVKFDQGIVFLDMRGSCSGCPSSQITLKQGIETRLKEAVPAIVEVRAL